MLAPMRTVGLLLVLLAAACQDHTTGVQTLCNAPRDCAECQNVDPAERDRVMAKHIERSVRNDETRALFDELGKLADAERVQRLRAAAEEAGLSSCILADRYAARAEAWEAHQKGEGAVPPPE